MHTASTSGRIQARSPFFTAPGQRLPAERIGIRSPEDIARARQRGAELSRELTFSSTTATLVATVISELARHILQSAKSGRITIEAIYDKSKTGWYGETRVGLRITAENKGTGIVNPDSRLGGPQLPDGSVQGLLRVRMVADEFSTESHLATGNRVNVVLWASRLDWTQIA